MRSKWTLLTLGTSNDRRGWDPASRSSATNAPCRRPPPTGIGREGTPLAEGVAASDPASDRERPKSCRRPNKLPGGPLLKKPLTRPNRRRLRRRVQVYGSGGGPPHRELTGTGVKRRRRF